MKRLYHALFHSISGFKLAFQKEPAVRLELLILPFAIILAFYLAPDKFSLILMIASYLILLITELLNTGIEKAIDRISLEKHELAKFAKDVSSAAVFVAICLAAFVWSVIIFF